MKKDLMGMHPDNRYREVKWKPGRCFPLFVVLGIAMLALSLWIHTGG